MDLMPKFNQQHYELKNYQQIKEYVESLISQCNPNLIIQNEEDRKLQTYNRRTLNGIADKIANARKQLSEILIHQYQELESLLKVASATISNELDIYKHNVLNEPTKPKLATLEVKSYDIEFLRMLKDQIESLQNDEKTKFKSVGIKGVE